MVCDIVPGQAGGSYISTIRFATLLRQKGHHVIIIAAKDSKQKAVTSYKDIPIYQYFSLPTPGSHRYYFQSFPRKHDLCKIFKDEEIEIVHIMFPSYSCFVAKQAAKELELPLVAHIHTQPENIFIFLPFFLKTKIVYTLILRYLVWFVRGARQIICPSELGKNIYQKLDPSLPISVISNGINLLEFHQTDIRPFIKKYNLPESQKHILFVGRFTEEKDTETLLRAMPEILRNDFSVHLDLIGTGPLEEKLKTLSQTLGIRDAVSFLGKVSDEDLLAAYNLCTLFVLPSKVELEGMVVLEAMACGKPILIANSETSASKYFVHNNGLLFEPGNHHDLAIKALKILGDNRLRIEMEKEGLLNVQNYDIHKSIGKLEEIYYSVL